MDIVCLERVPSNSGRGLATVDAVRPLFVVELPPALDQDLGLCAAPEPFPIQHFVPQLTVEVFDEAVLLRAPGRAERRAVGRVTQRAHDLGRRELGVVVEADKRRLAVKTHQQAKG